jgi:hypothetical protein
VAAASQACRRLEEDGIGLADAMRGEKENVGFFINSIDIDGKMHLHTNVEQITINYATVTAMTRSSGLKLMNSHT